MVGFILGKNTELLMGVTLNVTLNFYVNISVLRIISSKTRVFWLDSMDEK